MGLKHLQKTILFGLCILMVGGIINWYLDTNSSSKNQYSTTAINFDVVRYVGLNPTKKEKKKTNDERTMFHLARVLHEYYQQVNPTTGTVSYEDKAAALKASLNAPIRNEELKSTNVSLGNFAVRGPSNLGGRTRAFAYDIADATGNTMIAGCVSGGVFRTTNGGASWTKVSSPDHQHNVTAIVQDPRVGFRNIWYYSTGEALGNSASFSGAFYMGHGVWTSTDNGLTWSKLPMPSGTNNETVFDHRFDLISNLAVHPSTGDLFVAALGAIFRRDISASAWVTEMTATGGFGSTHLTDVVIASTGRVYASFAGVTPAANRGVWTTNNATGTGAGTWSRIATNATPTGWAQRTTSGGRAVMSLAPSNQDILYVLYENAGGTPSPGDSDLWRWNQGTSTWTNFSSKIPDEPGGSAGNDPFSSQGGYDLVVSVKPDNADFVCIGGTNIYKVTNINTASFVRIGGYAGPSTYAKYTNHHPDIHKLVFSPFNAARMISASDGGIHETTNINAGTVAWNSLNNNYQTYQYYHIAIDPLTGSDGIIGGAQDNGTTMGGVDFSRPNATNMLEIFSGDGCAVAISRADACVPFYYSSQSGNLRRDCPVNAAITPAGSSSQFVTYFWLDPDNNTNLYYAGNGSLYKTNNAVNVTTTVGTGATNWRNLGVLPNPDFIQSMTTTWGPYTTSSDLFIGGDEGRIFRLTNPANATNLTGLVNITPPTATTGFPSIVTGLAVHPTNPNILMAVYSNYGTPSIFITSNAKAATPTWTMVERNIAALSIRSCAIVENGGQTLYVVGTDRGLYSSLDPTTTDWAREAASTLGFSVISRLVYRPSDNKLLIGTHGNGIYIADVLPPLLPVELGNFTGKLVEGKVQLNWNTHSEENNEGFEVQRSFDGASFEKIGFVNGKGSTSMGANYRFTDSKLQQTVQYYRLRQVDFDGSDALSKVIAVQTGLASDEGVFAFSIYPNPVQQQFNLELSSLPKGKIEVELYSVKGDLVYQEHRFESNRMLNFSLGDKNLPEGTYLLRVLHQGKLLGTRKLFKVS